MKNIERIENYKESILSLKRILKTIDKKDNDIKMEIWEEIRDYQRWIKKLKK